MRFLVFKALNYILDVNRFSSRRGRIDAGDGGKEKLVEKEFFGPAEF